MTFDELKSFFHVKTDTALAEKLDVSKAVIHKWKNQGIPTERQAIIQIQTKGELKADGIKQLETA